MQIADRTVVVTGGARGIGRALCEAFQNAGARAVVVADIDLAEASRVAEIVGGIAVGCDVSREDDMRGLIKRAEAELGAIDLFCNNAGILGPFDPQAVNVAAPSDAEWQRVWEINTLAHVHAARELVPLMKARGGGYFLNTVSAAGVLTAVGSAPYAVSKHAALAFAECLAVAHRADGIRVSVLCPQAVDTAMLRRDAGGPLVDDGIIAPAEVAKAAIEGIAQERFLILPHPVVADYMAVKGADYDRWLGGMAKIQAAMRQG